MSPLQFFYDWKKKKLLPVFILLEKNVTQKNDVGDFGIFNHFLDIV